MDEAVECTDIILCRKVILPQSVFCVGHLCIGVRRSNECPGYDTKQSDSEAPVNAGALGNAEYPFIAIVPRFTIARSGSTW